MHVSAQHINIISINQKLLCAIEFQTILVYLNAPKSILQKKVEKQWQ